MSMFEPDYRHMLKAAQNRKPARLPLYEHIIGVDVMEEILGTEFAALHHADKAGQEEFFRQYCRFFREMTYDTASYEVCVCEYLPGGGALGSERAGVIRKRADFDSYPWDDFLRIFWEGATPRFDALAENLPPGMKAVGGIGNGLFEISEDLVGFEQLCYMQVDDPELFAELYRRIGDLLVDLWTTFVGRYGDAFCVCRSGDDMGFKSQTLVAPQTLIEHVVPQYRRITNVVHDSGHPYLLHSCGCIFDIMDPLIEAGIDAKHSNEDVIAPYDHWIEQYGDRIGLFGGIDTDHLCRMKPDRVYEFVIEEGRRFRRTAKGFALGSGNSIPGYVPVESYLAMVRAVQEIRRTEAPG